jgi:UDP-N-acetylmuramoyl-L-alanyl-D-glutamate--2,6-diaminopimelate ligase
LLLERKKRVPELSANSIKELLVKLSGRLEAPPSSELKISRLVYDSRKVEPGVAFFCMPGEKTDGNQFVGDAIKSGASLVVSEHFHEELPLAQIIVPDVRQALADFADALYGQPSRRLRLIAVTGTNGKTTSTHLIERILDKAGKKAGIIGTLGSRGPGDSAYGDAKHTTPQAPELQEMLSRMVESGCSHVAMEVSSHSLALKRVAGCHFAVACLTNVTQDHLDFHKTMDHYWKSKRLLFEALNESCQSERLALVNLDDPLCREFLSVCRPPVRKLTYGFSKEADIHPLDFQYCQGRSRITLATPGEELRLSTRLVGQFNVYNIMAAAAICLEEGTTNDTIAETLAEFSGVPGRFETVSIGSPAEPLCIVDYAHTPDGLDNVLQTAARLKKANGRLICVFGCGGDRDPSKRPQMGEIAEARADLVIVTSDNPRTENPQEIIAHILSGIKRMKTIEVEPDRARAIRIAIDMAAKDDIVLVAGKGHENYQLIMNQVLSFDDKVEVCKALEARFARSGSA